MPSESVRRDYLHAYDYPVENTPFLNAVKGTVVEGMTSAGKNTVASLRGMLTPGKVGDFPDYSRTVTGLAKADGLATYWLLTKNVFYGGRSQVLPIDALRRSQERIARSL